ncbi:homoserine dehydrogenase [Chitinispirillales bacterium ANBcel5]|uniref:homoserine dehydrogenase n=1 Tax=Cellulosispirillum alkaliphilum TaxID=3039283 RepID=UPI002A528C69|nr:homoserine dehydrogenase [Chitinispirillales bacterium ANBcel5]
MVQRLNIGLIGAGTVGGGVIKVLNSRQEYFNRELGLSVHLERVVDKDTELFSKLPVGDAQCSTDIEDILGDDTIPIVVELIGGTTFAKKLVIDALNRGKHVVTANKALIAEHGPEIFETAAKNGVSVYFEAAVGGGMPVIKAIREGLVGNDIVSIKTIINGTCNYILTRMTQDGRAFNDVLKEAQVKGYAEADPTLDVGGGDTAHKVAIMASLTSNGYVPYEKISCEGITAIAKEDIDYANELGYTIKLLGVIKKSSDESVDVRVHPVMLSDDHILASVSNEFNAVLLEGDSVGEVLLYGKGAGELPTASAVVSDIIDVARNMVSQDPVRIPTDHYSSKRAVPVTSMDQISGRYYMRFSVADVPGVLATITKFLGDEGISIASVIQREIDLEERVPVIIVTHHAAEKGIRTAIEQIEKTDFIRARTQVIRIED